MKAGSAATQHQVSTKQNKAERGKNNAPGANSPQAPAFETLIHVELAQGKPTESPAAQAKAGPEVVKPEPTRAGPSADEKAVEPEQIEKSESPKQAPAGEKVSLVENSGEPKAASEDGETLAPGSQAAIVSSGESPTTAAVDAGSSSRPVVADQPIGEQQAGEQQTSERTITARQSPPEETVAVARDPLGLMPRQEASGAGQEQAKEPTHAKSEAAAGKPEEPRHGRVETMADTGRQQNTQNQQTASMPGAAAMPTASVVARAMPVAGGAPQAGTAGVGQVNSLAGLTGRQSIWKLENAGQRTTAAAGKANPESQVARAMVAALRHKGGVVTLRLSPDELGQVRVELRVEDGRVSAVLDAQDERARGALHAGIDTLRKSLEASGLTVTHLEVVGAGAQLPVHASDQSRQNEQQPQHNPQQAQDFGQHGGEGSSDRDSRGHEGFAGESDENSDVLAGAVADGTADDLAWSLRSLRLDTVV